MMTVVVVGKILIWLLKERFWDPSSSAAAAPVDDPVSIPRHAWLEVGNSFFPTTCAKCREKHCQGHAILLFGFAMNAVGTISQKTKDNETELGEFDHFITLLPIRTLYSFQIIYRMHGFLQFLFFRV